MSYYRGRKRDFIPPPFVDDVGDEDFGPYSRDEIIAARASLLHTVQRENSEPWRTIKYKLGILPSGDRLQTFDPEHVWLPRQIPELWTAPVVLHDPNTPSTHRRQDHDPNAPSTHRRRDQHPEDGEGQREESQSESGQAVDAESQSSSNDGQARELLVEGPDQSPEEPSSNNKSVTNTSSSILSGKRKRESQDHSDEASPGCSGDGQEGSLGQETREDATPGHDAGEGSSKRAKLDLSDDEGESEKYYVMYMCDLCQHVSQNKAAGAEEHLNLIIKHLHQEGHYSASKYLAVKEAGSGELRPVYLAAMSVRKAAEHIFKEKVPACPRCHMVFSNLGQCMTHTRSKHQEQGLHCFRYIEESIDISVAKNVDFCEDCELEFEKKKFQSHLKKTRHMPLYKQEKNAERMMIFPCPFCHLVCFNYGDFRHHAFQKHDNQDPPKAKTVTATFYILKETGPEQYSLPANPGIPKANIILTGVPIKKLTHKQSAKKKRLLRQELKGTLEGEEKAAKNKERNNRKKLRHKARTSMSRRKSRAQRLSP